MSKVEKFCQRNRIPAGELRMVTLSLSADELVGLTAEGVAYSYSPRLGGWIRLKMAEVEEEEK